MPSALTYPGVYIEEVPSGVRTITGVATSITAFIGRALQGPVQRARAHPELRRLQPHVRRTLAGEHDEPGGQPVLPAWRQRRDHRARLQRRRGGQHRRSSRWPPPPAIWCWRPRAPAPGARRCAPPSTTSPATPPIRALFNLTVEQLDQPGGTRVVASESFRNVSGTSTDPALRRHRAGAGVELRAGPYLRRPTARAPPTRHRPRSATPPTTATPSPTRRSPATRPPAPGSSPWNRADLFNLLCIPPLSPTTDVAGATWAAAATYCQDAPGRC